MTTTLERPVAKLRVYGSEISYSTGELEGYLRYKQIPYQRVAMTPFVRREVGMRTGTTQMPAVELPDGRWMTDTTPMIAWLETQQPEPEVIPRDPLQAYASRLLEDYADEWLWRPALHYRWSYRPDVLLLSRRIVVEIQGAPYRTLPVSRYRVWCLERLRAQFETLSGDARAGARALLDDHGCWEPLWRVDAPASGYAPGATAPFAPGLPVFGA